VRLGYNTNGLAHHDPYQAVELLADLGYRCVGLSLDHFTLNPYGGHVASRIRQMRQLLDRLDMRCVVETGARYLLDPRQKHEPTLVTSEPDGRERRIEFYRHAIDAAAELGADCVSIWSGVLRDGADEAAVWRRLESGLARVLEYADSRRVEIGFEPEPGMFVDTMARYDELVGKINHPRLRLTLDIGHLHCLGEVPIADQIARYGSRLVNVHIEDMRAGTHEHLMFGEGEIDFPPVMRALSRAGYGGGVYVELSRHSHEGPAAAERALAFLAPLLRSGK
jgi:sugar phosphate isomerase/epimerase